MIQLLRKDGIEVREQVFPFRRLMEADEVFSTGNFRKVEWCTRLEGRDLAPGPVAQRARDLYWDFAHRTRLETA